ncbi:MAG: thiol reductase thioredoxin [Paenibacillus sp. RIFOXYA1_FULL_44_5]|nr:MAG: thiol reductase thioredoxin [Paenibacillus sp. RIFOXYA1_FULL_44_5]
MQKIHSEQDFRTKINEEKPTVAVFRTEWCPDCHFLDSFFPGVVSEYADRLNFIEIDRDELGDLCYELKIMGIPSFVVFTKSQEIVRFVSKLRKTRAEVTSFLDRAIEVYQQLAHS